MRSLKANHESWVSSALAAGGKDPPIRIRRIRANIPNRLTRVRSGGDLNPLVHGSLSIAFEHEEPRSDGEAKALATFAGRVQDFRELVSDFDAAEQMRCAHRMTAYIRELEDAGTAIFGGREVRQASVTLSPGPSRLSSLCESTAPFQKLSPTPE